MDINAKRAFIISDTHLGMRSNSIDWLSMVSNWFDEDFIPKVKEMKRDGDILIHCGDVFDNRQSINILVMNKTIGIFEKLSKIFDTIIIIAGNHDVMKKTTNDVSSLDSLKYIPGIHILKEPGIVNLPSTKLLMMPWRGTLEEERKCITDFFKESPEYLFCHTNIQNLKFDRIQTVDEGLTKEDLENFKRVYSGHIHLRQSRDNVYMVGNPYQMTRSDAGNEKGWYLLDFESGEHEFHQNDISPKFKRIYLNNHLHDDIDYLKNESKGNRIDLYIPNDYHLKYYNINPILDAISSVSKTLDVISYDQDELVVDDSGLHVDGKFNILSLTKTYVESLNNIDDRTKQNAIAKVQNLYDEITKR